MTTDDHLNEVRLVGRVSSPAGERIMPSGDVMAGWRVVVQRPPGPTRCRIDALDCVTFREDVRTAVAGWRPGALVEVHGSLRRRFWQSERGLASRYEVEAHAVRLIRAAEGDTSRGSAGA